jgi:hypothetical protein
MTYFVSEWKEPTGTQVRASEDAAPICARCGFGGLGLTRTEGEPYTVLLNKSYCVNCYPKMVELLEAMEKALVIQERAKGLNDTVWPARKAIEFMKG